jgi:hypothetical protein
MITAGRRHRNHRGNSALFEERRDRYNARSPSTLHLTGIVQSLLMFNDRRTRKDRRQQHRPEQIPPEGCRRLNDRRDCYRQYQPTPWWLRTNYVEEVEPPLLDSADAATEHRTDSPLRMLHRHR